VVGDVEETSGDDATTLAGTAGSAATAPLIDPDRGLGVDTVAVLETNIDDMPANLLADVVGAMIDDGALDAFLTPIVMKKGRSAHLVTVICHPADAPRLAERLVRRGTESNRAGGGTRRGSTHLPKPSAARQSV